MEKHRGQTQSRRGDRQEKDSVSGEHQKGKRPYEQEITPEKQFENFLIDFKKKTFKIPFFLESLNDATSDNGPENGGLESGKLMLLQAQAGSGKTSWMVNQILFMIRKEFKVVFFSLDMGYKDILIKFIRLIFKIGESKAKLLLKENPQQVKKRLIKNNFFSHLKIYTQKNLTGTSDLASLGKIEAVLRRDKPHAVVLDHLTKVEHSGDNIYKETMTSSKFFQFLKEELNMVFYLLTQIGSDEYDGKFGKNGFSKVPSQKAPKGAKNIGEDADLQLSFVDNTKSEHCPEELRFTLKWKAVKNRILSSYVPVLRFWKYSPISTQVADNDEDLIISQEEINEEDDSFDNFLDG